jgi:hypothetical protein
MSLTTLMSLAEPQQHKHLACCGDDTSKEVNLPIKNTSDLYQGVVIDDPEMKKINAEDHMCISMHSPPNKIKLIHQNENKPCNNCLDIQEEDSEDNISFSPGFNYDEKNQTNTSGRTSPLHAASEPILVNDHAACPILMSQMGSLKNERIERIEEISLDRGMSEGIIDKFSNNNLMSTQSMDCNDNINNNNNNINNGEIGNCNWNSTNNDKSSMGQDMNNKFNLNFKNIKSKSPIFINNISDSETNNLNTISPRTINTKSTKLKGISKINSNNSPDTQLLFIDQDNKKQSYKHIEVFDDIEEDTVVSKKAKYDDNNDNNNASLSMK